MQTQDQLCLALLLESEGRANGKHLSDEAAFKQGVTKFVDVFTKIATPKHYVGITTDNSGLDADSYTLIDVNAIVDIRTFSFHVIVQGDSKVLVFNPTNIGTHPYLVPGSCNFFCDKCVL